MHLLLVHNHKVQNIFFTKLLLWSTYYYAHGTLKCNLSCWAWWEFVSVSIATTLNKCLVCCPVFDKWSCYKWVCYRFVNNALHCGDLLHLVNQTFLRLPLQFYHPYLFHLEKCALMIKGMVHKTSEHHFLTIDEDKRYITWNVLQTSWLSCVCMHYWQ